MFVFCHRLLIWKTQTCSWRNETTDDVLPRFSRQPMEKKEREFLLSPLLLRSWARTDQLRGCKIEMFSLHSPHFVPPYKITSHFFLFSCFLFFFHIVLFKDKTRRATRMLQTQAMWSSNVPPPFLLCYWWAVGQLKAEIGSAGSPSGLAGMRTGFNGWTQMLWMCQGKRVQGC